jgi:hypothetical protein
VCEEANEIGGTAVKLAGQKGNIEIDIFDHFD